MELTISNNEVMTRLEADVDGEKAVLDYRIENGRMIVLYVGVPVSQRGHGLGGQLGAAAVKMAAERKLEIVPVCSFMAAYMRRHAAR